MFYRSQMMIMTFACDMVITNPQCSTSRIRLGRHVHWHCCQQSCMHGLNIICCRSTSSQFVCSTVDLLVCFFIICMLTIALRTHIHPSIYLSIAVSVSVAVATALAPALAISVSISIAFPISMHTCIHTYIHRYMHPSKAMQID